MKNLDENLIKAILDGKIKAITSIYENKTPIINEERTIYFPNEKAACVIQLKEYHVIPFKEMTEELAKLEGYNLEKWRAKYLSIFESIDPTFEPNKKIIVEVFEVVKNLVVERLELGKNIALANIDIFSTIEKIKEIDSNINNIIFEVNDQYIIKICLNHFLEEKIKNEIEFYQLNKNSEIIPKLYRYDISKFKFDYMYEILEKVSGKSLYFSWPKMNEDEREKTIQKLVLPLKSIHHTDVKPINSWSSKIKNEVKNKAIEYKSLFNQEDYLLILESLKLYDICLSDNHFAYIHNNLQFNNIIYNNGSLKLIDFKDALVAPIDFEFRKLYITQEEPWRYNNSLIENAEIYQNIFNYIKKYYKELGNIKYLDLRMLIYTVYEDMKLLDKYQTKELINNIIKNTQKLINLSKTEIGSNAR